MSDHLSPVPPSTLDKRKTASGQTQRLSELSALELIDQCLASLPEGDERIAFLYQLRHRVIELTTSTQQHEAERTKMQAVIEKLTAPANRIGTLVELPEAGVARIMVGGAEYFANLDPRLEGEVPKVGHQILVNEAYVVIRSLGYDGSGPVVKIREVLSDGRLRIDQDAGRQGLLIQRADELAAMTLKVGDEVRLDPTHRLALERVESSEAKHHLLAELPSITWEQIGGQKEAIDAIRRSIEYPLLHEHVFQQYQFQQPKGFLLYGPPGCGKTLIGQATAASLGHLLAGQETVATLKVSEQEVHVPSALPPIDGGIFLHVKGPEILNMWVGESERIVRDLFMQARQHRQSGKLPFIFIDEAESILGTRRAVRSYNVANTLVPMFCTELDGIERLSQVVVILASNRPDLIDPAVIRPGRIDRKIKVGRPGRPEAAEILRVYLTPDLPYASSEVQSIQGRDESCVSHMIDELLDHLFQRNHDNQVLTIRLRNGRRELLYRRDLLRGAVLSGIVRRAKERANTLVPMFCTELDGIERLSQVVVILASNRPDLIDPAVIRPGRIDRKIKVGRPGRPEAAEILRVYLTPDLPYASSEVQSIQGRDESCVSHMIDELLDHLFQRNHDNQVLTIRLRNGRRELLYRRDLLSGAVLSGIVRRAKERAIERVIQEKSPEQSGLTLEDLKIAANQEFQESEIFPPDDSAEEWLKLLDYHPDQVVGVSPIQLGKDESTHVHSQIV